MSGKESFNDKDVLMSNLSDEVPSYSTFDDSGDKKDFNQNSHEDSKPTQHFHQVVNTRTNIQNLKWVRRRFKMKYCSKYVPCNPDEERCHCGRSKEAHDEDKEKKPETRFDQKDGGIAGLLGGFQRLNYGSEDDQDEVEWDPSIHLKLKETNAHGDVVFNIGGKNSKAKIEEKMHTTKLVVDVPRGGSFGSCSAWGHMTSSIMDFMYIRLASDNLDIKDVINLLLKDWKLSIPEVLISVVGDDDITQTDPNLAALVSDGLTQTANSTGAWIITKGINGGVIKSIAEQTVCIGIASWGTIYKRKELTKIGETVEYQSFNRYIKSESGEIGENLDKSHTHFLLVDDGYVNKYGGEVKFRVELVDALRNYKDKERGYDGVPSIRIVLGGQPQTIEFLLTELKKKNPIPVIIIEASGKSADILALAYRVHQTETPIFEMENYYNDYKSLKELIEEKFPFQSEDENQKLFKTALECMNYKNKIFVYEKNDRKESEPLDEVMLDALLKGNNLNPSGQLNLAMLWNRVDIARNKIIKEVAEKGQKWTREQMRDLVLKAIHKDKSDFVELFLEIGVNILWFCFELDRFYSENLRTENSALKLYMKDRNLKEVDYKFFEKLYADCSLNIQENSEGFHEFFLWAVITNKPDMMYLFWSRGEDFLRKALIAAMACKVMAEVGQKYRMLDDVINEYETNKNQYHELAMQLLNECSNEDERLTRKLLLFDCYNEGTQFKSLPSMTIAAQMENDEFIAHSTCQNILDLEWEGALHIGEDIRVLFFFKFLCCMVMPLLIPLLQRFRKKEHDHEDEDEEHEEDEEEDTQENINDVKFLIEKHHQSWKWKITQFYQAPVIKFYANVVSFIAFLLLYTFVITGRLPKNPYPSEWLLMIWVIALLFEELLQLCTSSLFKWISSKWNLWDALAIILFFVGFGLRMNGNLSAGRIVYAIDLMLFIMRVLELFYVDKTLGPYVVMIGRMTGDLMNFIIIALVFMIAYGIGRDIILNPDSDRSFSIFARRLIVPYFQIYGELFMEYPQTDKNVTIFSTENYNDNVQPLVMCIMGLYLLVANVLLLNILIAVFNNTYVEVQEKADIIWKFKRYHLVKDYKDRSFLPPPFTVLLLPYLYNCWQCLLRTRANSTNGRDKNVEKITKKLMLFEECCLNSILQQSCTRLHGTQQEELAAISDRTSHHTNTLTKINNLCTSNMRHIHVNRDAIDKLEETVKTLQKSMELNHKETKKMIKGITEKQDEMKKTFDEEYPSLGQICRLREEVEESYRSSQRDKEQQSQREKAGESKKEDVTSSSEADATTAPKENVVPPNNIPTDDKKTAPADGTTLTGDVEETEAPKKVILVDEKKRPTVYPKSGGVHRFILERDQVSWEVDIPDYNPAEYTAPAIFAKSRWTDDEIVNGDSSSFKFNEIDEAYGIDENGEVVLENVDRRSHVGIYQVIGGIPRNPVRRTGLIGRGILGRYGPNHICTAIFTRKLSSGCRNFVEILVRNGEAPNSLLLPQGTMRTGTELPVCLANLFSKKSLLEIGMTNKQSEAYMKKFEKIMENKMKIYEGYLDDRRRHTDNAWLETVVYNFNDEENMLYKYLLAKENYNYRWKKVTRLFKMEDVKSCFGEDDDLRRWLNEVVVFRKAGDL